MDVVEKDGRWLAEEAECDPEEVVSQLREGSARDAPVEFLHAEVLLCRLPR